MLLLENRRNLIGSYAIQSHSKNASDNTGSFLIHDPAFGISRVLDIAIWRLAQRLAGCTTDFVADPALLADIAGIPFIEQIANRSKLVFSFVGINAI